IKIARKFGIPVVVAVNRFPEDSEAELEITCRAAEGAGAYAAVVADHWARGGDGALDLARAVSEACEQEKDFRLLYPLDWPIEKKVETIAREVYNADGVVFSDTARAQIERYTKSGFADLPICMAKTHLSISHDPKLKGVPSGYTLPVREVRASVGAGFIYPLCGEMRTMPGLPSKPAFMHIDFDENGEIVGLF
ncbi:formate--tetrahydrofolate ligase, partial [Candidatus Bipolaricaulota bacterium]|nr:formate--tetrahydrofolate ligase [Candidatus Bipolaricaulota bacterium]